MPNEPEDELWVVNSITDTTGLCIYLSETWRAGTGQDTNEALGHGWLNAVHPDDKATAIEKLTAALEQRIAFSLEFRVRRSDGAYRWVLAAGAPRFDDTGFLGYAGSIVDIHRSRDAQRALLESEEKLRLALAAAEMGTFVWRLPGGAVETDAQMLELLGRRPDDSRSLTAALDRDFLAEDRARFAEAVARASDPDGDGRLHEDIRLRGPEGTLRWLHVSAQAHFAERFRSADRIVGAAIDVTARELAKEELRISQERQAFLLRFSDAIRPLADPVRIQREAAMLLGRQLHASRVHYGEVSDDGAWGIVREDWCDGVPSVAGRYHLDSYGPAAMEEFRAGRTLVIDDVGPDERLTPQERMATTALDIGAYVIAPLVKGGGLVALFVVHFRMRHRWTEAELGLIGEVAERTWAAVARTLAEERLAVAHERLTATLRASPVVTFEQDRDLRYVWVQNPALGYRAEQVVGKTDADLFEREEDARAITAIKQRVLDAGTPAREEVRIMSEGVTRWYDLSVEPRRAGEEIVGVLCTAIDVTERKHAEIALKEADRRKEEFLAVLGHELRNPLASIQHGVQILERTRDSVEPRKARAAMDLMTRQVRHLSRLADDLMDISGINQAKIELRRELVDIGMTLRDVLEVLRPQIDEKDQRLETSIPVEPLAVFADVTRLSQILANLIGNAIRYTDARGAVRVRIGREGDDAVLAVHDSGAGIAPDVLPHLFSLFMQADRTPKQGLGIGLALSKKLVELHGGAIEAHSPGIGKGATFVVRLPLASSVSPEAAGTPEPSAEASRSIKVLVIDDNRDVADTFAMLLDSCGVAFEVRYDGQSGVEAARSFRPDIVFIDLRMPGMDGYETARRIRANSADPEPTLIALSGLGRDKAETLAAAGFDLQLEKPVMGDAIAEIISRRASQSGSAAALRL